MSDAAVDTSSEITTKVVLDAARPPFLGSARRYCRSGV